MLFTYSVRSRRSYLSRLVALLMTAVLLVVACEGPAEDDTILSITIPSTRVSNDAGSQFIQVSAGGAWVLDLVYQEGKDWASLDISSGEGITSGITLSWTANDTEESRNCQVVIHSGKRSTSVAFTQGGSQNVNPGSGVLLPKELVSDPVPNWLELPATDDDKLFFITHDMKISGKVYRNYSYYLDTDALLARWVAYPLNRGLRSSGSDRTNAWGMDPKVPRDKQAVLLSGFRTSTGGWGFDRGHQLPSADRYAPGANEDTFFGTNMTPQRNSLNAYAWATLEGMVRNWSYQCDTLYVVTGADISASTDYAVDNDGKKVAVPNGYFKALLAYKKSMAQGYFGIAFYLDHKEYESSAPTVMKCSMTIDELEEKLGYDFFVNLPSRIDYADKVESTIEKWWNDNIQR